jgi:hypothetical protein
MTGLPPIPDAVFRPSSLLYWCLLALLCAFGSAYTAYGLRDVLDGIAYNKSGRVIAYATEPTWFIIGVSLRGIIAGLMAFLAIAGVAMAVSGHRMNRAIRKLGESYGEPKP